MANDELAGTQRAAILLMSLGEQDAANLLKQLDAREVQKLGRTQRSVPRANERGAR
jgi:flagellar motor switch protein FliG